MKSPELEQENLGNNMKESNSKVLKYGSLVILVVQNAGLILSMRYARIQKGDMFIASTAVAFSEFFKLLACLAVTLFEMENVSLWMKFLYDNIIADFSTTLKVAVPSLIYVIQNNLQYVAVSNLDAATFQVTYQLKILTTALLSVIILRKNLSKLQWFSLVLLTVGVALVQLQDQASSKTKSHGNQNPLIGLSAVVIACFCSGFAGVYFEKILKGVGNEKKTAGGKNIWLRNIQLGMFGFLLAIVGMFLSNMKEISEKGVMYGYNYVVWFAIFMQAFGGLLVAVVVKYADNILKGFATSFSIIISCLVSVYAFQFVLTVQFFVGSILVIIAVYIYGRPQNQPK